MEGHLCLVAFSTKASQIEESSPLQLRSSVAAKVAEATAFTTQQQPRRVDEATLQDRGGPPACVALLAQGQALFARRRRWRGRRRERRSFESTKAAASAREERISFVVGKSGVKAEHRLEVELQRQ
jgi:hypothetical protein